MGTTFNDPTHFREALEQAQRRSSEEVRQQLWRDPMTWRSIYLIDAPVDGRNPEGQVAHLSEERVRAIEHELVGNHALRTVAQRMGVEENPILTRLDHRIQELERELRERIINAYQVPAHLLAGEQQNPEISPEIREYSRFIEEQRAAQAEELRQRLLYAEMREETQPSDPLDRRFIRGREHVEGTFESFRLYDRRDDRADALAYALQARKSAPAAPAKEPEPQAPRFRAGRIIDVDG